MAALMTWNSKLDVGVAGIDQQHRKLVDILNRLNDAMHTGHGTDVLGAVLDDLVKYTANHFAFEEDLMRKHGYPAYPAHKKEHDDLVKTAVDLQTKFKSGETRLSIDVLRFLRNWLTTHIQGTDKALGAFCQEKKVA
jgi:hemerythrin